MNHTGAVRTPAVDGQRAWAAAGVAALVMVGYLGIADLRVSAAIVGAMALAAWAVASYCRPAAAISCAFLIVLVAGTKFRIRDASASLDGVMDGQILLELTLFAAAGVAVVAAWLAAGDRRRLTGVEMLIAGYTAVAMLSALWSMSPVLTLVRATQLAIVGALAIAAVRLLTPQGALWRACSGVAAYSGFCAALAFVFPWASGWDYYDDRLRFAWFSVHPIAVGTLVSIAALGLLATALWSPPRRSARLFGVPLAFYAMPMVALLVLTNSRGPLLAFVAGVAMLVLIRLSWHMRVTAVLGGVAAALLLVVVGADLQAWLSSQSMQDSAASRLLLQGQTADAVLGFSGRFDLWTDAGAAIADQALVGYGYQASRSVLLDIAAWAGYAHNALLQTLLDLGLVGSLALVALVGIALSNAMRSGLSPWLRGTTAALMVFLVLNSISTESFAGAPGFETLLLFICALAAGSRATS